jgi:hypothetical protein
MSSVGKPRLPIMSDGVVSAMQTRFRPALWGAAGLVGAMVAGTILLWVHYGSAVFFEMIIAGLAACF